MEFGIWAILGIIVFVIAGILSAELDSASLSAGTFVIGLIVLEWGLGIGVWALFVSNPLWIIGSIVLYVALGAAYTAFWRWPEYICEHDSELMDKFARWAHNLASNEDKSFEAFMDSDEYNYNAWQHKERLGTWVGMWPFSLSWELARKPAIWVWNTAYNSLGSTFQSAGRRAARKIHDKG